MENNPHTWDQIPSYLYELGRKVDHLTAIVSARAESEQQPTDKRFTIEELCDYLPGHPAQATIYGKVQRQEIPFDRMGKRLTFLKSEIDAWLNSRKGKTIDEIKTDALKHTAQPTSAGRKSTDNSTTVVKRKGSRTATV